MTSPDDAVLPAAEPPGTGDDGIDPVEEARERVMAALSDVDDVANRPPGEQVAAYTAAHQTLQATLAGIDDH
ncbi:MAG TPA: hypothetical protein VKB69_09525 [Micromonosporaceae bacterium]|nr:hypothetical protein [Micromonosporaceae bacterium]